MSITQADNECRLEGDKTHEIVHFLSKKVGGDISYVVPTKLKSGGGRVPPVPHRSTPVTRFIVLGVFCARIRWSSEQNLDAITSEAIRARTGAVGYVSFNIFVETAALKTTDSAGLNSGAQCMLSRHN